MAVVVFKVLKVVYKSLVCSWLEYSAVKITVIMVTVLRDSFQMVTS